MGSQQHARTLLVLVLLLLVTCAFPSSPSFPTNRKSHVIRQLRGREIRECS